MSDVFLGEIRLFAGNYAPVDWAYCDGSLLAISDNEALFSLIGTTYGGDGQLTFGLPDLRGRLPVGQGAGPGLTPRVLGETFGTDTVTLTRNELPSHTHAFSATLTEASSSSPENNLFANTSGEKLGDTPYAVAPGTPQLNALNERTVSTTGANLPHENIMPSKALNYIISLNGIYPSFQ